MPRTLMLLATAMLLLAAFGGLLGAFGAMMELGTIWGQGGVWDGARQVALLGVLFFPLVCLLCGVAAWRGRTWFFGAPLSYATAVIGQHLLAQAQQWQPTARAPPDAMQLGEWLAAPPGAGEVGLSNNVLTEVPAALRLDSLEVTSLAYNPIRTLPDWLGQLPRLRLLYLGSTGVDEAEVRRWQAAAPSPVAVMQ